MSNLNEFETTEWKKQRFFQRLLLIKPSTPWIFLFHCYSTTLDFLTFKMFRTQKTRLPLAMCITFPVNVEKRRRKHERMKRGEKKTKEKNCFSKTIKIYRVILLNSRRATWSSFVVRVFIKFNTSRVITDWKRWNIRKMKRESVKKTCEHG